MYKRKSRKLIKSKKKHTGGAEASNLKSSSKIRVRSSSSSRSNSSSSSKSNKYTVTLKLNSQIGTKPTTPHIAGRFTVHAAADYMLLELTLDDEPGSKKLSSILNESNTTHVTHKDNKKIILYQDQFKSTKKFKKTLDEYYEENLQENGEAIIYINTNKFKIGISGKTAEVIIRRNRD